MRLDDLILRHDAAADENDGGVPEALGDPVLVAGNPIHGRVRQGARQAGVAFSTTPPHPYFGHPLLALPDILATRVVPVRDTVAPIRALVVSRPGYYSVKDLERVPPVRNPLTHESAHVVAYHAVFGPQTASEARATLADPATLPILVVGEAFAVVAEHLVLLAAREATERFLVRIGGFQFKTPGARRLTELASELGVGPLAALLIASQVLHNQLRDELNAAELDEVLVAAGIQACSAKERRRLRRVAEGLMQLNPAFRRDTARLFLTQLWGDRRLEARFAPSFLRGATGDRVVPVIGRLARLLAGESAPSPA